MVLALLEFLEFKGNRGKVKPGVVLNGRCRLVRRFEILLRLWQLAILPSSVPQQKESQCALATLCVSLTEGQQAGLAAWRLFFGIGLGEPLQLSFQARLLGLMDGS